MYRMLINNESQIDISGFTKREHAGSTPSVAISIKLLKDSELNYPSYSEFVGKIIEGYQIVDPANGEIVMLEKDPYEIIEIRKTLENGATFNTMLLTPFIKRASPQALKGQKLLKIQ